MTPRLCETRAGRKAFVIDATRQLRVETLAGAAWIFNALAGAGGLIRRMLLRITAQAAPQAQTSRFPPSTGASRR